MFEWKMLRPVNYKSECIPNEFYKNIAFFRNFYVPFRKIIVISGLHALY